MNNNNDNKHIIRKEYRGKHVELIRKLDQSIDRHKQTLRDRYGIDVD